METPRRRSQNREAKREEAQTAGIPSDIKAAENCVNAVQMLQNELNNAKKTLINADNCIVNRAIMQEQLEYLAAALPDTVKKAAVIVHDEETIRSDTEKKRKEILDEAENQAKQTTGEAEAQARNLMDQATQEARALMERANQEANGLMEKANQEASACVEAARAEAARMLEDAEKKARQMIEEESVVRRARVESDELREKVQKETAMLRKNTLDFVDQQLMDADRSISEMLNAIRLERNEVRNRRQ